MGAQITTLDNGLRIVSETLPGIQTTSLGMWVGVGSRFETPAQNGISHFLEHMAFKGTQNRTAIQIATEIENVGGYLNAYTSRENTAYHARVLSDNTLLAADIIADILQNSTFLDEEIEKERTVILQEISQSHDTPDDIIFEHFQAAAFPNQPLGRSILGPESVIKSLTSDDLREYMNNNYKSSNMVFAATGGVDHDELVEFCEEKFSNLRPHNGATTHPGTYQGGRHVETRTLEQVHMLVGFESVKQGHPDFYATAVLSSLLGGGMSSRLFQEVREKRGLVYSIYTFNTAFKDTGLFGIYAGTGPNELPQVMPLIAEVIHSLEVTLSDEEINRSKCQLKAGLMMALESTTARCEQLAQHMLIFGKSFTSEEIIQKVDRVQKEDVLRVAQQLFQSPATHAAIGPGELEAHMTL